MNIALDSGRFFGGRARVEWGIAAIDAVARELMLFAAAGFLLVGFDDLLVDVLWLAARVRARFAPDPRLSEMPRPERPMRFAIFVAAWKEQNVIGGMLRTALDRVEHPDYRIFVGTYPNDPATIAVVRAIAEADPRVRLVIGPRDGPTTKGDNLNVLWRALVADDARTGLATDAVVLHDAEDVVHAEELAAHEAALFDADVSQTPVKPLIDDRTIGHWIISSHYADEFAASHRVALVVRAQLRAGLPLAGVGCAVRVGALQRLGDGGDPFEPNCLTEDYEQGLRLSAMGYRARFLRVRGRDGSLIATEAYFPREFWKSTSQKARWLVGISLAGWDRIGWARPGALAEHWMRMRDRRAPLATLIIAIGYLALLLVVVSKAMHDIAGTEPPGVGSVIDALLWIDLGLVCWRIATRAYQTGRVYGWLEGVLSVPRIFVANGVAIVALARAFWRYAKLRRDGVVRWDKTDHIFPDLESETAE